MAVRFDNDVFTKILLRLRVKSVLKFKTVSKQWHSIIYSPSFRQSHASRHRDATGLFYGRDKTGLFFGIESHRDGVMKFLPLCGTKQELSWHDICVVPNVRGCGFDFTCVSSCNGLLLLKSSHPILQDHTYFVYNPTTKKHKYINVSARISTHKFVCASLAFDPSQSPEYKVVFLWRENVRSNKFQIEVYSSKTGTYRAPLSDFFVGNFDEDNRGIYFNGSIHWLSYNWPTNKIVYFDVHSECINEVPTPEPSWKIYYFGESRGHLYCVQSKHEHWQKEENWLLDVYKLKRDYSEWFLKYQVDPTSIASRLSRGNAQESCRAVYCCDSVLSIFCNKKEVEGEGGGGDEGEREGELTMVLLVSDEFVAYNIEKKTIKRLFEKNLMPITRTYRKYWVNTHQFVATLAHV